MFGVRFVDDFKRSYRKKLWIILVVDLIAMGVYLFFLLQQQIPKQIYLFENDKEEFDFELPVTGKIDEEEVEVSCNSTEQIKDNIEFSLQEPFTLYSQKKGSYDMGIKLFGFIPVKNIHVKVLEKQEVIPSGETVGIKVDTDGIMVLGTGKIIGEDGNSYEPAKNIVHSGDYIRKINNIEVDTKEELVNCLKQAKNKKVVLVVERNEENIKIAINAVKDKNNEWKLGVWVRDDTQGIGTVTYITKDGEYGALGHGISDIDTGLLMEVKEGVIYNANVYKIVKGEKGIPGEMVGYIQKEQGTIGTITQNTSYGIFGKIERKNQFLQYMSIGLKQSIELGEATILCKLEDEVKEYTVEIEDIDWNGGRKGKELTLKITDEKLLNLTNGIVQGMSGSPIVQNGSVIGAVTHVFVNDPTRGYGIFIENMLEQ